MKEGDCNGDDNGGDGVDDDDGEGGDGDNGGGGGDDDGGGDPGLHVPESRESLKVLRQTGELIVLSFFFGK